MFMTRPRRKAWTTYLRAAELRLRFVRGERARPHAVEAVDIAHQCLLLLRVVQGQSPILEMEVIDHLGKGLNSRASRGLLHSA